MAIKTYQPTSAGMRFRTGLSFDEVTKTTPEKGLRERLNEAAPVSFSDMSPLRSGELSPGDVSD